MASILCLNSKLMVMDTTKMATAKTTGQLMVMETTKMATAKTTRQLMVMDTTKMATAITTGQLMATDQSKTVILTVRTLMITTLNADTDATRSIAVKIVT